MRAVLVICAQCPAYTRPRNIHTYRASQNRLVFVCIAKTMRAKRPHETPGSGQASASRDALLVPDRAVIRPVDHPLHPLPQVPAPDQYGRPGDRGVPHRPGRRAPPGVFQFGHQRSQAVPARAAQQAVGTAEDLLDKQPNHPVLLCLPGWSSSQAGSSSPAATALPGLCRHCRGCRRRPRPSARP